MEPADCRATEGPEDYTMQDPRMVDELMADFDSGNAWGQAPPGQVSSVTA